MKKDPKIYCPRCEYRPQPEDRWLCHPSCGTSWHTFWTGGVCPGCSFTWPVTQCPACHKVSPHQAWYHYPDDQPAVEESSAVEDTQA
jgi:hypothetical protein